MSNAAPTEADLDAIAERLFTAFVAHDFDVVATMLAPGAVISQNGNSGSYAQVRPGLEAMCEVIGDHQYTEVRRVIGDHAVVEEHHVVSTTPAGHALDLAACVVIRVDDDGLITEVDEYVDVPDLG